MHDFDFFDALDLLFLFPDGSPYFVPSASFGCASLWSRVLKGRW